MVSFQDKMYNTKAKIYNTKRKKQVYITELLIKQPKSGNSIQRT